VTTLRYTALQLVSERILLAEWPIRLEAENAPWNNFRRSRVESRTAHDLRRDSSSSCLFFVTT
jgi:hypothetical protein